MTDNQININELIKIEQMPKVFEQLEEIGKWVDTNLQKLNIGELVYDEDHKQEYKKVRAEINKVTKVLEDKRKEIKEKILEPYNVFEEKYNTEVKFKLAEASNKLGDAISEIEVEQKKKKEDELKDFFYNRQKAYCLEEIIDFENVGLNITLSASVSSLKEQIVNFVNKICEETNYISSLEHREEILMEYKRNGFNCMQAINTFNAKLEEMKALEEKLKLKDAVVEEEQKVIQNVNTLMSAPVEVKEEEYITCEFTITTTKEKIKKLKEFLIKEDIKYE